MIRLPAALITKIATLLQDQSGLGAAYQTLSDRYHADTPAPLLNQPAEVLAYIAARMPATYAAVYAACAEVLPLLKVTGVTDLGGGPGSALWAISQICAGLKHVDVMEQNPQFLRLNQALSPFAATQYHQACLMKTPTYPENDAVIASYVLNELSHPLTVVARAWAAARRCLILIEPGTPTGFANLKAAREYLIAQGAFIAAPCTHHEVCPLSGRDWCHFSVRLERPLFHRLAKRAVLPYEDEKYAYLIATRMPLTRPVGRIIKNPLHRGGNTRLDVCQEGQIQRLMSSKREGARYRRAKDARWGDGWEEDVSECPLIGD